MSDWNRLSSRHKSLVVIYVAVAAGALVATWWNNIEFFSTDGNGGLGGFVDDALATPASASLTFDVVFVGLAAQLFMLVEGRRVGMSFPLLVAFVFAGSMIAIAVAFPLFLAIRELRFLHVPERLIPSPRDAR